MAIGKQVWFNGKLLPEEQTRVSLFTHSLHYGVGAFEGIRAYKQKSGGGAIFRLKEHVNRLYESSKILGITIPFSPEQVLKGCIDTCKANSFEECYVRPLVFVGDGPVGLNFGNNPPIHLAILAWEWPKALGEDGNEVAIKVKTSSFIRPHPNSVMTLGKISGQYVTSILARREAITQGFDEALFFDPEGYLTEGSGENLFIVKNGKVKTPPLNAILNGITRQSVIDYFAHKKISLTEERFSRDELWCADEVFLTGTAAEVTPVKEIDNRAIADRKPGPVTLQLMKDFQEFVRGNGPAYTKDWLTPLA